MTTHLLLDTHVFVWLILGEPKLSRSELLHIEKASSEKNLFVSVISVWEIAMLQREGRLMLTQPVRVWTEDIIQTQQLEILSLTPSIACESVDLPEFSHKDPADRIIVATARILHMRLMTHDARIRAYAKTGHVDLA